MGLLSSRPRLLRMLSRRRRAFHLRRVMLAAGLWMKLRKRRRCAPTTQQNSGSSLLSRERRGDSSVDMTDDVEDVMDGAPSDDNLEPPQPRGPVRSRKPPTRKPGEEGETAFGARSLKWLQCLKSWQMTTGSVQLRPSGPKPRKAGTCDEVIFALCLLH
eukprot:Skav203893  [mRNA]  locus=scaffold1649:139416:142370:+ [translate_table: standard]